eukprot:CAMPEP_0203712650 /NCGR_PEP_ID=MMETSP0091-20130426/70149_1 /ASSEMBLY_ACC=CAM_ASM_001089 /TAXON_ID=426623 /ORGANISM="Chaetoceros affinis, Strain CCMP159" /LENGTH=171 /DNA_ID=CAMNT_0050590637 /DNA_START=1118 /DNA_END=1633 /DNA_ORIENTATION=-
MSKKIGMLFFFLSLFHFDDFGGPKKETGEVQFGNPSFSISISFSSFVRLVIFAIIALYEVFFFFFLTTFGADEAAADGDEGAEAVANGFCDCNSTASFSSGCGGWDGDKAEAGVHTSMGDGAAAAASDDDSHAPFFFCASLQHFEQQFPVAGFPCKVREKDEIKVIVYYVS